MRIDQELAHHSPAEDSVLAIGVFDGVHLGHRHLISVLKGMAKGSGCLAGIVTFLNHPAAVLKPGFNPLSLTGVDDRLKLIRELGADFVVPVSFDLELSKLGARQFAALLQKHLRMIGLVVGVDFTMGRGREGDVPTLVILGREMGFFVHVVEQLVDENGQTIRSTLIREALARGDVTRVAALIDRNFHLSGTVSKGLGRGMPLGFPTANLRMTEGVAVPGDGIYATWADVDGQRYMSATSIGVRPTFGEAGHAVEVFILDFPGGDLYGRPVRVEFVRRLRDQEKFDTVRALQEKVDVDVDRTRAVLQADKAHLS